MSLRRHEYILRAFCGFERELFTVKDIAKELNVSPQTIRRYLVKMSSDMSIKYSKVHGRFMLTLQEKEMFLKYYLGEAYNKTQENNYNSGVLSGRGLGLNQRTPKGKGKISYTVNAQGRIYWYLREFPLYFKEDGSVQPCEPSRYNSKEEAIEARQRLIDLRDKGAFKGQAQVIPKETFYTYLYEFFERQILAPKTRKDYLKIIEGRIKPYFKDIPIDSLTPRMLQDFVNNYDTCVDKMFTVLKQPLDELFRLETIEKNLYSYLKKPKKKHKKKDKQALSPEEIKELFQLAKEKGFKYDLVTHLLLETGIRVGEGQALQWSHVEFKDDTVVLNIEYSWGLLEDNTYGLKEPKTASSKRKVYSSDPYTIELLKQAKVNSKGGRFVLENAKGDKPLDKRNISERYFKALGKEIGLHYKLTAHYTRVNYITHGLYNGKLTDKDIQAQVGHSDTTLIHKTYGKCLSGLEDRMKHIGSMYDKAKNNPEDTPPTEPNTTQTQEQPKVIYHDFRRHA